MPKLRHRTRILIVEPEAGGHHFVPYAVALAVALLDAAFEPMLLTTREATAEPAMSELIGFMPSGIAVRLMPRIRPACSGSIPDLLRAQLRYWLAVRAGVAALDAADRPALCVLLGLDSCDRAIATLGSPCGGIPFVGLTIHAKHHWPAVGIGPGGRMATLNRWAFDRVLASRDCLGVASIDETLVRHEALRGRHSGRVRFVPDPGEVVRRIDRDEARRALGIDASRTLVLVYGGLDGRKNVAALLAAARAASTVPLVALVGRVGPDLNALKTSEDWTVLAADGRLLLEDGFASVEREALWFGAADLVWVGYRADFLGQSAVIPQAASAGVPVLGRRGGLIGRVIESHGLGRTVDPADVAGVKDAIDALATSRRRGEFSENLRCFAADRTHRAYGRAWLDALTAWCGRPTDRVRGVEDP